MLNVMYPKLTTLERRLKLHRIIAGADDDEEEAVAAATAAAAAGVASECEEEKEVDSDGEGEGDRDGEGRSGTAVVMPPTKREALMFVDFVRSMLNLNHKQRSTCTQLLTHPWLQGAMTVDVRYEM